MTYVPVLARADINQLLARLPFASDVREVLAKLADGSSTQRAAAVAFSIRVAGAAIVLLSQAAISRWLGVYEFGIYGHVWTWVVLLGSMIDFGFATTAQRFLPEYIHAKAFDVLRGFLFGSRWFVVALSTTVSLAATLAVHTAEPWLDRSLILPMYLGCLTLPMYGLIMVQDGIARAYNWVNLALMPLYIIRPLAIVAFIAVFWFAGFGAWAATIMAAAIVATWLTAILQLTVLNRRLAGIVERGPKGYESATWLRTSLPVFLVGGFYFLLTYTDVLVLAEFRPPDQVAVYYAATKIIAPIALIYFSIWAIAGRKFSEYHVEGDRESLAVFLGKSIRWTFFSSLMAVIVLVAIGRPVLRVFGPEFAQGYTLLPILGIGLLARAAIGPAERLLNMLGEQRICSAIYAAAFAVNLIACVVLIPRLGTIGAAAATSIALIAESAGLFMVVRSRLRMHAFVFGNFRAPVQVASS